MDSLRHVTVVILADVLEFLEDIKYLNWLDYRLVFLLKWYNEEETKELREAFENAILSWPNVEFRKMFGCPCYLANGKMFAGMVTNGIIITKLTSLEKEELKKLKKIKPFVAGDKIIKTWVNVDLDPKDLKELMPFVKKSYDRAKIAGR